MNKTIITHQFMNDIHPMNGMKKMKNVFITQSITPFRQFRRPTSLEVL